jgi:hypothetical protein
LAIWAVLLNVPPPEIIDHAPVVAPPPIVAPLSVIADGDEDWQTGEEAPASTIGAWFTVIVLAALTGRHGPAPSGSSLVRVNVTVPKNPDAGVKVTPAGLFVDPVLLKLPLPDVILHVPFVVPPVTPAPLNGIVVGDAD